MKKISKYIIAAVMILSIGSSVFTPANISASATSRRVVDKQSGGAGSGGNGNWLTESWQKAEKQIKKDKNNQYTSDYKKLEHLVQSAKNKGTKGQVALYYGYNSDGSIHFYTKAGPGSTNSSSFRHNVPKYLQDAIKSKGPHAIGAAGVAKPQNKKHKCKTECGGGGTTTTKKRHKPTPDKDADVVVPQGPTTSSQVYTSSHDEPFSVTLTGVYSSSTQLSPEKPDDYANWSTAKQNAWDTTHHTQTSDEEESTWGKFADSLNNGSVNAATAQSDIANLQQQSAEAQQGDYVAHPKVQMDSANRKGFSQGGVFDVTEFRKAMSYTWTGSATYNDEYLQTCTTTYKIVGGVNQPDTQSCSSQLIGSSYAGGYVNMSETPTDAPYSYWQMINVRCNKDQFSKLAHSIDGFTIDSNGNGNGSQTGHTRVYRFDQDTPFANRPLGNDNQSGIQGETAKQSFYENANSCEVPINCNSVKRPSASNASSSNVQDNGTNAKRNGKYVYGAQANGISSDYFTFFRDGTRHQVRTDLWYPTVESGNGITIDSNKPAAFTRLYFDTSGTPNGKLFGMASSSTGADFVNGANVVNGFAYKTSGELTNFWPHATWASSSTNPERFNIDWTWQPTIKNTVYSNVDGNSAGGDTDTDKSKVYASCAISMNTTKPHHPTVQNNLFPDEPLKNLSGFNSDDGSYVSVGFVRSSADEH